MREAFLRGVPVMINILTRLLLRRGIYTGAYSSDHVGGEVLPRPAVYLILNRRDNDMVRIEAGFGARSYWIDWGKRTKR